MNLIDIILEDMSHYHAMRAPHGHNWFNVGMVIRNGYQYAYMFDRAKNILTARHTSKIGNEYNSGANKWWKLKFDDEKGEYILDTDHDGTDEYGNKIYGME